MSSRDISDSWDYYEDTDAADNLVRSCLAFDDREERSVGQDAGANAGTGYRMAWAILQRYRVSMVRSERNGCPNDRGR